MFGNYHYWLEACGSGKVWVIPCPPTPEEIIEHVSQGGVTVIFTLRPRV